MTPRAYGGASRRGSYTKLRGDDARVLASLTTSWRRRDVKKKKKAGKDPVKESTELVVHRAVPRATRDMGNSCGENAQEIGIEENETHKRSGASWIHYIGRLLSLSCWPDFLSLRRKKKLSLCMIEQSTWASRLIETMVVAVPFDT